MPLLAGMSKTDEDGTSPEKASSKSVFDGLEKVMKKEDGTTLPPDYQHVFLHPDVKRSKYTEDELKSLSTRDFESRIFITETNVNGLTVFLQTHFSDNHARNSNWNYVRDLLKATVATKNYTCARSTLTQLLAAGFRSEKSVYCSFAASIASGLSDHGERTHFELLPKKRTDRMVAGRDDSKIIQRKLCILMNIVFSKIQAHNFLVNGGGLNVYRLGHFRAKIAESLYERFVSYLGAVFCFLLQSCMAGYVAAEMYRIWVADPDEDTWNTRIENATLAFFSFCYTFIIFWAAWNDMRTAHEVAYHKWSFFRFADWFVNFGLYLFFLFAGIVVITDSDNFIEAVLNAAALLFVLELDDNLHEFLGNSSDSIIENYLTKLSMAELDQVLESTLLEDSLKGTARHRFSMTQLAKLDGINMKSHVNFCDYYLTNLPEQGSDPLNGFIYQPFMITKPKLISKVLSNSNNVKESCLISPSSIVTESCLIKKIKWWYTSFKGDISTTNPRIGKLEIELLSGSEPIVINPKREEMGDPVTLREENCLEGVFIITAFQMSVDVLRLRLCGSKNAKEFKRAFEYYSLWEISAETSKVLDRYAKQHPDDPEEEEEAGEDPSLVPTGIVKGVLEDQGNETPNSASVSMLGTVSSPRSSKNSL